MTKEEANREFVELMELVDNLKSVKVAVVNKTFHLYAAGPSQPEVRRLQEHLITFQETCNIMAEALRDCRKLIP